MFPTALIALLAVTSAFAAPTNNVIREDDHPDEVVVLASCSKGSGTTFKVEDRMVYFSNDYARRKNGESQDTILQNAIHDPAPHDGMVYRVSWHAGTVDNPVSGKFPKDGRVFKVWDLPSSVSARFDEAVSGSASLGGAPFKCYRGDDKSSGVTLNGYDCSPKFTCTRLERWIRQTHFVFDDATTIVGEAKCDVKKSEVMKAQDAFAKLKEAVKSTWDTTTGFDIGAGCKMFFPTIQVPPSSHNYDNTTPQQIVDILVNNVGAAIEKNRTVTQRNCNIPGYMGQGTNYHITQDQLTYPRGGKFEIFAAQQSNPQWITQTRVDFRVQCACRKDRYQFLAYLSNGLGVFGGWISPVFGTVAASINIANLGLGQC
ncbi:hypothetical protein GQ44DRAFT_776726 [Phaeosphaeriaceae sp. PMI808]|nr:hypothetical protein GQ44DRAFT_776726 [Phaeosphaeriaceae sp. PMI808]